MDYRKTILDQTDRFHLNAASGWLGLGDFDSAGAELEQISSPMQDHPEVLLTQIEICDAGKKWKSLLPVAEKILQQLPKLDSVWIHRSFALHELNRTQEAFDALLPAAKKFPKRWLIRYNLACYCAQLGQADEALRWLQQAMNLASKKEIKTMALGDPDFAPLRKEIRAL